jgi:hypothetical protein
MSQGGRLTTQELSSIRREKFVSLPKVTKEREKEDKIRKKNKESFVESTGKSFVKQSSTLKAKKKPTSLTGFSDNLLAGGIEFNLADVQSQTSNIFNNAELAEFGQNIPMTEIGEVIPIEELVESFPQAVPKEYKDMTLAEKFDVIDKLVPIKK